MLLEYNHQDVFINQPPLDSFSGSWEYDNPEFWFQETSDLRYISLLDMVLSDPCYAPNFSLLQEHPVSEYGAWNNEITEGYNCHHEQEKSSEKKKYLNKKSKTEKLCRETISQYFYMPIAEAAKAMKVGLTCLKKRCRELGIRRWPRRKLISLQTLINNVQEMGKEEEMREAIKSLEREKKLLEEIPDMELQGETKRLRQACFKSNYKKRKLMEVENTTNFGSMLEDDDQEEFMSFLSDPHLLQISS